MTLDDLIDRLRRIRAAYPDLADAPARMFVARYESGEYDHDAADEIIDMAVHTDGVVVSSYVVRTHPRQIACDDQYLEHYERSRRVCP